LTTVPQSEHPIDLSSGLDSDLSSGLDSSTFPLVLLHPKQALDGRVATGNVTARVKKANAEIIQQSERLEHRFNVTCNTAQTPCVADWLAGGEIVNQQTKMQQPLLLLHGK